MSTAVDVRPITREVPLAEVLGYLSGDFDYCMDYDTPCGTDDHCTCWPGWGLESKREDGGYPELLVSIRAEGIKIPIAVRTSWAVTGQHEIANGHHRLAAAQELGIPTVPVTFYT